MNESAAITDASFHRGDKVVLAEGPYQGSPGVFLNLTKDVNWAEIAEPGNQGRSARTRIHPAIWLKHAASETSTLEQ